MTKQRRLIRAAWAPSRLRRIWRHRMVRLVVLLSLAAMALSSISQERAAARAEIASWQDQQVVVIIDRFVSAGEELAGSVSLVERPGAMVPDGALSTLPTDAIAAVDLVPGELLLTARVRSAGQGLLPRGTVAITVQLDGAAPLVTVGDLVDLWVTNAANFSSHRAARAALVLHHDDGQLTIAVPEDLAGSVAVAALRPLTVTLVG